MELQEDFDSLAIPEQADEFMEDACPQENADSLGRKTGENYVPVNFIPEGARKVIMAWELKQQEQMQISGLASNHVVVSSPNAASVDVDKHARICAFAAPPKRYYRTFWKSVTRRLLG